MQLDVASVGDRTRVRYGAETRCRALAEDAAVVAVARDLDVELRGVGGVLWRLVMMVGDVLRQRLGGSIAVPVTVAPPQAASTTRAPMRMASRLPHPCYACVMQLWSW